MAKRINESDFVGKRYGRLVVKDVSKFRGTHRLFECECDCGETVIREMKNIRNGKCTMCDECKVKETYKSIINKKVGKLFVTDKHRMSPNEKTKAREFFCICECGTELWIQAGHLTSSSVTQRKSCGCVSHNKYNERNRTMDVCENLKDRRHNMIQRCKNPNHPRYHDYGGRGIDICDEWMNDPDSFYSWALENGYKKELEIDRINNDGNYEPSNCRWVSVEVNSNNRRNTLYVELPDGSKVPLKIYCNTNNLNYKKYLSRFYRSSYHDLGVMPECELLKDPKKGKEK